MRVLLLILIAIFLNAQDLEITKYISYEKPKIVVYSNKLPSKLTKLLKIDTKIISHYNMDIKDSFKDINISNYNYSLTLKYKQNQLVAKLYDNISDKTILYKRYKIPNFNVYPFMIHSLSYDINSKLGFKKIPWIKKRVIYSVYMSPKETSIFVGDITLTYRKKIISGGLNIFPKWVDRKQTEIYYTKLENYPVLYKYNVYTGQKSRILSSKGMLIVSDVKGDNLLLTLALNDQPDIYSYNIKTHNLKRITKFVGIDVSGRFYDDGIVFISNRLGYPNVYKKNLDTGKVSRFIYRGKNHISVTVNRDKVIVSSRETSKAFSDNSFNLLLVEKNSDVLKRLTFTGKNLQPNFSDDGDTILFIKLKHFNSKFGIIRLKENRIYYFNLNRVMQSFDF